MDFENFSMSHLQKKDEIVGKIGIKMKPKIKKIILTTIPILAGLTVLIALILIISATTVSRNDSRSNDSSFIEGTKNNQKIDAGEDENQEFETIESSPNPSKIHEITEDDLSDGARSRVKRGDTIKFYMEGINFEIFIDSVKTGSVEITIKNIPKFETLKNTQPKKFDFNLDNYYDLEINILEIIEFEAIIEIKKIKEYYEGFVFSFQNQTSNQTIIIEENKEDSELPGFQIVAKEIAPYECTKSGLLANYIYFEVWKKDGVIIGEQRVDIEKEDFCVDSNSYIEYYCESKTMKSRELFCESKYDDCVKARCETVRFDRNLKKQNSPIEPASGLSECHLQTTNTLFWAKISKLECETIFIASKIYTKPKFINLLQEMNLDTNIISNYFNFPQVIKISYNDSSGNKDEFLSTSSKLISDSCKGITFLNENFYCTNQISIKSNNLRFVYGIVEFLEDSSSTYSSSYVTTSTFNFIKSKNILYTDGSKPELYEIFPGYTSENSIGCISSKLASHRQIMGQNVIFICKESISIGETTDNRVETAIEVFLELLSTLNYNPNTCDKVDKSRYITVWGPQNLTEEPEHCENEPVGNLPEECVEDEIWLEDYHYYVNMNSLQGEKINYLYSMSTNNKLSTYEKRIYHGKASNLVLQSGCANGMPESFNIPPYP